MPRFTSRSTRHAAGAAAIVLGLQLPAAAQDDELAVPPVDKIRLEYRAPAECPDAETFRALVGTRVPAGWEAAPDELARHVEIQVSGEPSRYVATIEFVDERGELLARAVRGQLCENVVDGIALVTALVIQSRTDDALDRSEAVVTPAPAEPENVPEPPAAAPPSKAPEAPRPAQAARNEPSSVDLRVSARAALTTAVGPDAAPGAGLGIVLEWRKTRLGLALQGFSSGRVEAQGIPARFRLYAARVEGCPFVFALADWASVEPCPFVELGAMTGEGFEDPPAVARGDAGSAPWFSAGGAGRMVGRFGAFVVELEGLLGVPLRREEFYVEGGDVVYRVPALYVAAAAGFGARF